MPKVSKLGITTSQYKDKNEYQRQWRKLNPNYEKEHRDHEKVREGTWRRRYGITRQDYNEMLEKQNSCCAICGTKEVGRNHTHFHVDHNHTTGKIRGLLCDKCNRGLGYFNDTTDTLKSAYLYLEKYEDN